MKKTLTTTLLAAAAALTLSACADSTDTTSDPDADPSTDATGISDEQLAALDEVNPEDTDEVVSNTFEVDIPLQMTHLHGRIEPDHVSIICAGDYAFLHTWTSDWSRGIGVTRYEPEANATTVRFAEHDELCAQAQS